MEKDTLRMQFLSGVITEGEYKAKLQESLWDRIKDTPKAWIAKIKGGSSATLASAFSDGGIIIGKPVYFYDGGSLNKMTIKSINYNTGISDIIYEKSSDGGKTFNIDEKESLKSKLDLDQDLSSLLKKTPEERKTWYDKIVKDIKDSFTTKDVSYRIEDLKPDTPREKRDWKQDKYIDSPTTPFTKEYALENKKKPLKESMIGGIVGIGAINQIPPRAKSDYETAFEHFLGKKYGLNEVEIEEVEEGEINENIGNDLTNFINSFPFSQEGNDELIDFANKLLDGKLSPEEFTKLKSFVDELEFFKLVSDPNKGIKSIAQQIYQRLKQGTASGGGIETFSSNPEALQALKNKLS